MTTASVYRPGRLWLLIIPVIMGLLWWAFKDVRFQEVWTLINRLQAGQLGVLVGLNAGIFTLFSLRWWLILRSMGASLPFKAVVRYRLAAFGVNYFTPGPQFGGEPLQVYLLNRQHQLPIPKATTSVTLDKLLELLANFTFLLLGVMLVMQAGLVPGLVRWQVLPLVVTLAALPIGYLLALWVGIHPLGWFSGRIARRWAGRVPAPRLFEAIAAVEGQAAHYCREQLRMILFGLTLSWITWAFMVGEFWLASHYLGIELSLLQVIGALTAARLAFLMPMPGGLGALEASQVLAFQAMGFDPAVGASLSLLIRARDVTFGAMGLGWAFIVTPLNIVPLRLATAMARVSRRLDFGRGQRWRE